MSSGSGVVGTLTAIVIAISAWLPWFKSPIGGLFELSGSSLGSRSLDAWGLPASSLWSQDARPGGLELGYLIMLLAVALLAFTWFAALPRAGARLVGVGAMFVPVLWMIQIERALDRPQVVGFGDGPGITDLTGLGVYLMLIAGVVVALVGSGRVERR